MVQREDAEEDNSYDNIWILLVGLRFADEEYHRQHRRADQERHFAGAAQRLDRLEAAHAAPEGHQGQAGEEQPTGNQHQPSLIAASTIR